jgi:hypothetical protein
MELPKWVLKHKKKGTEVRCLNGRYYLYKISSRWDPGKKRAKKITEKFLGTITEDGMIKPRHERMKESMKNVSVKEFGATAFLLEACGDVADALRKEYPEEWRRIFTFSAFRLMHNSPLKNLRTHYNGSYLSETLGRVPLSPKVMGKFLRELGKGREKMKRFMKNFVKGTKFAVIDTTHVFSLSEGIITAVTGHNSMGECLPQTRLLLVHSLDRHMPAYFRMLQGDITDVTAVPLTVKEAGKKQHMLGTITVVTDCQESPEYVFGLLKRRVEVEFAFNAFKNTINADRTYMRDDYQLEGWMFVNFVSLVMYYRIYGLLLENGLLKRYSPKDVILHLSRVFRLKMGGEWILSEVPKKPRVILERLGMENLLRKNGGVKV